MSWDKEPSQGMGGGGTASNTKFCMVNSATGEEQEIISESSGPYGPIYYTKDTTNPPPGTAWTQQGFTRNSNGDFYSTGGVVKQINNPKPYAGTPLTSADPQDFTYLEESAPGAGAFQKMNSYVGGWWMNIFGLNQEPMPQGEERTEEEIKEHKNKKALAIATTATVGVGAIYLIGKKMGASKLL